MSASMPNFDKKMRMLSRSPFPNRPGQFSLHCRTKRVGSRPAKAPNLEDEMKAVLKSLTLLMLTLLLGCR